MICPVKYCYNAVMHQLTQLIFKIIKLGLPECPCPILQDHWQEYKDKYKNTKVMFGNRFCFLFSKTCFWEYKEKTIFLYFWIKNMFG